MSDKGMRSVLVTGGAGFIGSCLIDEMLKSDRYRVINLDSLTYASSFNLHALTEGNTNRRHVFVRGDIGDCQLVSQLLREHNPVAVINLAAESHVDRSIDSPSRFAETNVVGTTRLLEATLSYWTCLPELERSSFRFVHVSTDEVYGSLGESGAFVEDSPYRPNSPYAASKAASNHFARSFFATYGLPVVTTNCSNNFGPRQFPEKLIPLLILRALEGRPLPVYGDGGHSRDWIFVEDHCQALLAAMERGTPGDVYNIGANNEVTNREMVELVCGILDDLCNCLPHRPCAQLMEFVRDRPGHDRRYRIDNSKAERELKWKPRWDLSSALRLTVQWYLENAKQIKEVTSHIYRQERLGSLAR